MSAELDQPEGSLADQRTRERKSFGQLKSVRILEVVQTVLAIVFLGISISVAWTAQNVRTIAVALDEVSSAQMVTHFNQRYDALAFNVLPLIDPDDTSEGHAYWQRYWNLQLEQYLAFLEGHIEPLTFHFWLLERQRDIEQNSVAAGGVNYRAGYEHVDTLLQLHPVSTSFKAVLDVVAQAGADEGLREALEQREKIRRETNRILSEAHLPGHKY